MTDIKNLLHFIEQAGTLLLKKFSQEGRYFMANSQIKIVFSFYITPGVGFRIERRIKYS